MNGKLKTVRGRTGRERKSPFLHSQGQTWNRQGVAGRRVHMELGYGGASEPSAGAHGGRPLTLVKQVWLPPRPLPASSLSGFEAALPSGFVGVG